MEIKRSTLYNEEPINNYNSNIESLSSYIERLASLHNMTTGLLVSKLITPFIDKMYLNNINIKGGDGFYKSSNAINGTGIIANDFIMAMEMLTMKPNLIDTTFIKYNLILPTRGLLKNKKSWCPLCLENMREEGIEKVYFPLKWTLQLYEVCPMHKLSLVSRCPNCNKEMDFLSRKSVPGYCSKCMIWLGNIKSECQISNLDYQIKRSRFVEEMIEVGLGINQDSFNSNDVNNTIRAVVSEKFDNNIKRAARELGFSNTTFRYWYNGINQPPINALAQICITLNLGPKQFFSSNIKNGVVSNIPEIIKHTNNRPNYNYRNIQLLLKGIMSTATFNGSVFYCFRKILCRYN
jgi:hypothetical protein